MRFETVATHAGDRPDATTGAISVPICQISTFVFREVGKQRGSDYSRMANPIRRLKVFPLAESLGGITSLTEHPATMSHASMPKDCGERVAITNEVIRLSVGLENVNDPTEDLEQALDRL